MLAGSSLPHGFWHYAAIMPQCKQISYIIIYPDTAIRITNLPMNYQAPALRHAHAGRAGARSTGCGTRLGPFLREESAAAAAKPETTIPNGNACGNARRSPAFWARRSARALAPRERLRPARMNGQWIAATAARTAMRQPAAVLPRRRRISTHRCPRTRCERCAAASCPLPRQAHGLLR